MVSYCPYPGAVSVLTFMIAAISCAVFDADAEVATIWVLTYMGVAVFGAIFLQVHFLCSRRIALKYATGFVMGITEEVYRSGFPPWTDVHIDIAVFM